MSGTLKKLRRCYFCRRELKDGVPRHCPKGQDHGCDVCAACSHAKRKAGP